jgi:pimeloyl-ACP methyl ester carboxylesterase
MARRLASLIRGAELEILPGCGHWPMIEAPAAALRLLEGHLKETTRDPAEREDLSHVR